MLQIQDLTFRMEGRPLLEGASLSLSAGQKVGIVGRNGSGKTTLLKLIAGELTPDAGRILTARNARIGRLSQEAPDGDESLLDFVLSADRERAALLHEAESTEDPQRIAEIQLRLADIEAHAAPARAATILAGLGFDAEAQKAPCRALSGGWRMRLGLAALLFTMPDILLLDEPSNYLDLEGTLWLENFLRQYPHMVLLVSHDRDLLNRAVTGIVHLAQRRLTFYSGGYDRFEASRREQQRLQAKLRKKQEDTRQRMEAFVARFRYKATKARQAQSRLKALEKMAPIAAEIAEEVLPFHFPNPAKPLGNPLIRLEGVSVGYGEAPPVLSGLSLRIDADDRIGLLGANGNGKSTFAKLLADRLVPRAGQVLRARKLTVGYYAQHQLDELPADMSPYDHICALLPQAGEAERRARLGAWGFSREKADRPAAALSGGEKARLLFGLVTFSAPHLLILDEPTNHLDIDSREMLIRALNAYEGAAILISHDRHLLEATVDRLWLVTDGTVRQFDGDLADYRVLCLAERTTPRPEQTTASDSKSPEKPPKKDKNRRESRRAAAVKRQALAPLRKKIQALEKEIAQLSERITAITEALADPELYTREPERAAALTQDHGRLTRRLAACEAEWLAASEHYEEALAQS